MNSTPIESYNSFPGERVSWTAAELAQATRLTRRAIYKSLAGIPAGAKKPVRGKIEADAWFELELPEALKSKIAAVLAHEHCRTVGQLLASSLPWEPPIAYLNIAERERQMAERDYLAYSDLMPLLGQISNRDLEERGLLEYKRTHGHLISAKLWWKRFDEVRNRDAGRNEWQRKDYYVSERAYRQDNSKVAVLPVHADLEGLVSEISKRSGSARPSSDDRAHLLNDAFTHLEAISAWRCKSEKRLLKASLLNYLHSSLPAFCKTRSSLRKLFNESYCTWVKSGRVQSSLIDFRASNPGRPALRLCEKCAELLAGAVVEVGGNYEDGRKRLIEDNEMCVPCMSVDMRTIKKQIEHTVKKGLDGRQSEGVRRLNFPYVQRDWSDLAPGDAWESDDCTPNHYVWAKEPNGEIWIGRYEWLLTICRRTRYPWGYISIRGNATTPFGKKASYNSIHIRKLALQCHDSVGLPHKEWVMEKGVWDNRLVNDREIPGWSNTSWAGTQSGFLDRVGIRIRHARAGNPRTKVVERIFKAVHQRMRVHEGFAGSNEREEKLPMQDFLQRARAGKEHPSNEFLSFQEFSERLDAELMAYAKTPQERGSLHGRSPADAWLNGIDDHPGVKDKPLRKLPADCRYLISSHERKIKPGRQGIVFQVGKKKYVFWGPELHNYKHKEISVRFNIEQPQIICCQTEDGGLFTLENRIYPSSTASSEELSKMEKDRYAWGKHDREISDNLQHPIISNITRDETQSAQAKAYGQFHRAALEQHKENRSEREKALGAVHSWHNSRGSLAPEWINQASEERIKIHLDGLRTEEALKKANQDA